MITTATSTGRGTFMFTQLAVAKVWVGTWEPTAGETLLGEMRPANRRSASH